MHNDCKETQQRKLQKQASKRMRRRMVVVMMDYGEAEAVWRVVMILRPDANVRAIVPVLHGLLRGYLLSGKLK